LLPFIKYLLVICRSLDFFKASWTLSLNWFWFKTWLRCSRRLRELRIYVSTQRDDDHKRGRRVAERSSACWRGIAAARRAG
jgi:hypothetical protein